MKQSLNAQTSYVCACARITEEDFQRILKESEAPTYAALKAAHGIGGQCTSCEYEVKGLLDEHLGERFLAQKKAAAVKATVAPVERGNRLSRLFRRMRGRAPAKASAPVRVAEPVKAKEAGTRETYRTGVFFLRRDGLETHLAIANLQFPEHAANPNGTVSFHVSLYGEDGSHLATSREMSLANNTSVECMPGDLFPEVTGDVVGAMYTDFDEVTQTGSLRPYGVLVNTSGDGARARCHFHDKFALFTDPGFFQNTSPFEPGQTCWMSVSNCQPKRYESDYYLQAGGETFSGKLELEPMASRWVKLGDLFPGLDMTRADLSPGLFWMENPQHVMVYFFWHIEGAGVWMAQHH